MAVEFGFHQHEIAGANPRFGMGQSCIYTRFPIDVRSRLSDLKKVLKIKALNKDGIYEEATCKLKGIDKISLDRKKKLTITLVNTFKRVKEAQLVEWLGQFGEIIKHYPKSNPLDKKAEEKYPNYREVWRDSDYMVEINADPSSIPQIVPFQGYLIKLKFQGVKLQCQKCFNYGHLKQYCDQKKMRTSDYER
ncbi:Uncharacterized protein FKW44_021656, partial [Caligus rogercresseyi]